MAKDFRNKQFGRILRGYNPEEVDEYISYINDEYRKLERRWGDSERKLTLALKKLDELHRKDETQAVQAPAVTPDVVKDAQSEAQRILAEAKAQAEAIMDAAQKDAAEKVRLVLEDAAKGAEEILTSAEQEAADNRKTADNLFAAAGKMYGEVCSFRDSLFEIYNTHIESIEHMTAEAQRAMGVIEDTYGDVADSSEEADDDSDAALLPTAETEQSAELIAEEAEDDGIEAVADDTDAPEEDVHLLMSDEEEAEPEEVLYTQEEDITDSDTEIPGDLYIDPSEDEDEFDALPDEGETVFDVLPEEGEEDGDEGYDLPLPDESDDYGDMEELDMLGDMTIDWNSRHDQEQEEKEEIHLTDEDVFGDLDEMFTKEPEGELTLTDEFDLVFNSSNAKKNVEQIRKQPTVAPEKPKNPKKHQKF